MQSNLNNIYYLSLLVTFILSLFLRFKRKKREQEFIYIYLFITIINDVIISKTQLISQNISIFVYTLLSTGYFFSIYYGKFKIKFFKYLILVVTAAFIVFGFVNQFKIGFQILNINFLFGLAVFYIILTLCWFLQRIIDANNRKISRDFIFWLSCAMLLWGCFFIFRIIPTYLFDSRDPSFLIIIQNIFTGINILTYWIVFYGLIKTVIKS